MACQANLQSHIAVPGFSGSYAGTIAVEVCAGAGLATGTAGAAGLPAETSAASVPRRDQRLVNAAQAGCETAFGELFSLYSRRIHRTILAITKNPEDAEDAMQESFLRAFLAINRFEGRANFYSWLTRIAINSAFMILRRRRARPELSLTPTQEWSDDVAPMDFKDSAPGPEEIYLYRQRRVNLMRAIHRLSPNLQEVVRARLAEECSVSEVADKFNISEAAAKSRLYRARRRLGMLPSTLNGPRQRVVTSGSSITFSEMQKLDATAERFRRLTDGNPSTQRDEAQSSIQR
jgi:RNA polymerase sigma-70 factor (ECF subfamily)